MAKFNHDMGLQANGWFPSNIPWAEYVSREGPGAADGAMSYTGGNQLIMNILVYMQDMPQAIVDLLGTNTVLSGAHAINRVIPMAHPIFPWLYAERVTSIKPFQFVKKGPFPGSGVNTPTALYNHYMLSVLFTQPKFTVLNDGQLQQQYGLYNPDTHMADAKGTIPFEWYRYVEGVPTGEVEVFSVGQGNLSYRENGSQGPNLSTQAPITTPWRSFLGRNGIHKIWRRVPLSNLINNFGQGRAANLDQYLQHVNASPFWGYPSFTLKFESYLIVPVESVLPPSIQNNRLPTGSPSLLADVKLDFSFFDPPTDAMTHGHNNIPFSTTYKWYYASSNKPDDTLNGTSQTADTYSVLGPVVDTVVLTGITVDESYRGCTLIVTGGSGFIPGTYLITDIHVPVPMVDTTSRLVLDRPVTLTTGSAMTGHIWGQPLFPATDFYHIFQMPDPQ